MKILASVALLTCCMAACKNEETRASGSAPAVATKEDVEAKPAVVPAEGQSFVDGMRALCNPVLDSSEKDPPRRQAQLAAWLRQNVTNVEVRALMSSMAEINPADRDVTMREAVERAGLDRCPTLDD